MRRNSRAESGMVSFLFVAMLLPVLLVLMTVTIEFSHFFGIRDELQRVVDQEAQDALARRLTPAQVESDIRARMRNIKGMATISSVVSTVTSGRAQIQTSAQYSGALFQLAQRFLGSDVTFMPIEVSSNVRTQSSSLLIVVDRRVPAGGDECNDPTLVASLDFVDRLVDAWSGVGGTQVSVSVSPGSIEAADLLTTDASDGVTRCRTKSDQRLFDVGAVRGIQGGLQDAVSLAMQVEELSASTVFAPTVERRGVVFVMRPDGYDAGYSSQLFSFMNAAALRANLGVDVVSLVVDGARGVIRQPFEAGVVGASLREIEATTSEMNGARLLSAFARSVADRTVLER